MAEYGYDLAAESIALYNTHEAHVQAKINQKNDEIERLVNEMDQIQKFLQTVSERTNDSRRARFDTAEELNQIAQLRSIEGIRDIFPEGKHEWKGEEISELNRRLCQYVEGPLQGKIGRQSDEVMLEHGELTKITDLFTQGVQTMNRLSERILANMQRQ